MIDYTYDSPLNVLDGRDFYISHEFVIVDQYFDCKVFVEDFLRRYWNSSMIDAILHNLEKIQINIRSLLRLVRNPRPCSTLKSANRVNVPSSYEKSKINSIYSIFITGISSICTTDICLFRCSDRVRVGNEYVFSSV